MVFQPTYLYIKRHSVTGLCYFGKTNRSDPIRYLGSGQRWSAHIRKHGKQFVETLWCKLFTDRDECMRVALTFSRQQDIVNSSKWANMVPEDGLSNSVWKGRAHSAESKAKVSAAKKGCRGPNKGQKFSAEWRANLSSAHIGKAAWNKGKSTGTANSGSFKSGFVPWNKGTKGVMVAWNKGTTGCWGAPRSAFKPGNVPWNKGLRAA